MTSLNSAPFVFSNTDDTFNTDTEEITSITTRTTLLDFDGLKLNYDKTTTPKQFKISPNGINWTDGTSNHTTGLERLALVQTAFQAVELPPNATTLKLNDTILLTDGTSATNTIDNTGGTISAVGTFGTQTNIIDKNGYVVGEDNGLGHFGRVQLQRDNLQFTFNDPPNNWDFDLTLFANTNGGFCGIDHTERSSSTRSNLTISTNENLVLTADNIDLSSTGRLLIPNSLTTNNHFDYNAGKLTINNTSVGGTSNPLLVLQNNNNTAGSVAIETYKNKATGATNDTIAGWNMYANDYTGAKTEFARINATITNSSGGAGNDGAINFWASVNGTISNVMTLNGADNENNSFRPLDLTGNELKTSSGNLTINALSSAGTGDVIITPKTGANLRVGKTMLTNDKIQNLTSSSASSIDFASVPSNRFTIDKDKVKLDFTTGGGDTSNIRLESDFASQNNLFAQEYTTSGGTTYSTTIQNIPTSHRFQMADSNSASDVEIRPQLIQLDSIANGSTINIANNGGLGTAFINLVSTDGSTPNGYLTTINVNPNNQYLLCRRSDGTSNTKDLYIRNETSTSSGIEFNNTIDSNPLNIYSNKSVNLYSTDTGGSTQVSSLNGVQITGENTINLLTNTGADTISLTTNNLTFTGASLQSNTSSGNSGEHLVITLNGTQYKIQLQNI